MSARSIEYREFPPRPELAAAVECLWSAAAGPAAWAALALECGYYDQAHLIRDFVEIAGQAPTGVLAEAGPLASQFTAATGSTRSSRRGQGRPSSPIPRRRRRASFAPKEAACSQSPSPCS